MFSRRHATGALLALAAMTLAGCSGFTPVYSGTGTARTTLALAYAEPATRAEQIVYQDLALALGRATAADAPVVTITIGESVRGVGRSSNTRPAAPRELVLNATITVVQTGEVERVLYSGTRSAAASYTTNGQHIADAAAKESATEEAAHTLADTVRLTLLGELAGKL